MNMSLGFIGGHDSYLFNLLARDKPQWLVVEVLLLMSEFLQKLIVNEF